MRINSSTISTMPMKVFIGFPRARNRMSRRVKLKDIKRDRPVTGTVRAAKRNVTTKREAALDTAAVLEAIYPEVSQEIRGRISSLTILNPRDDTFESLLEELVMSYEIDPEGTEAILAQTSNVDELSLRLPSVRKLEYKYIEATEEEFNAEGGSIMGFACPECKGFEFYFDSDRQTSAGDEASHEQLKCKKCKPRYTN